MRIPSGVTDQYIYFVAVDSTDLKTRETGLSSFTVYRSRNGAAAAAYTTPTINETDSTNMPGVYELLLDEDMTLDAGDDSQEVVLHITQASMAPVTRTFELYRSSASDVTAIKTKTDYLPSATAGAAGGLFIAGANAATSITNTDGHALTLTGGTNGHGLLAAGAGTGSGLVGSGGSSGGHGLYAAGDNTGMGIYAVGGDAAVATTAGLFLTSQASSSPLGLYVEDGAVITNNGGTGLRITSTGNNGDGVELVAHGTGVDLDAPQAFGIIDSGTAQSASSTGLVLRAAAAFANDTLIGATLQVYGTDQGYWQTRVITDSALSGDSVVVDAWTVTPSGAPILYKIYGTPPASATALPAVNLVQVAGATTNVSALATNVDAIKTKTDYLPSATAGAAGGLFIAGSNAATSITTALTANITGNLSGSVGSVTGAVGSVTGAVGSVTGAVASVTGAVGSVTGNVGGNVAGSVGSVTGAVGSVTGSVGSVTGLTAADVGTIKTGTADIQSRLPAALENGRIKSKVEQIHTHVLTDAGTGGHAVGGS